MGGAQEDVFGLPPPLSIHQTPGADLEALPDEVEDALANLPANVKRTIKPSAPSPLLTKEESSVTAWITSRKGPRPRHRRDPGMKKMKRTDMPRSQLWYEGGSRTRPKYQPGKTYKGM